MSALAAAWTPTLASAALTVAKSTLLLGAAALGTLALRRGSAAARHLVWSLSLAGLVALPALVLVVPDWKLPFLAFLRPPAPSVDAWAPIGTGTAASSVSPAQVLLAVWMVGALAVLGRLVLGLRAAGRLARNAEVVEDPAWTELLERLGRVMEVRRPVALLRSAEAAMPLTWGALRPAILLPAEADAWTPERRTVVLMHELAHVARRDCLVQTLAEMCCAVWWFHPGAWWAARRMRVEREEACDDAVLAAGARASDYAGHLLDVARRYRAPSLAAAIAMARPSQLEGRVRAVLAAERDRRAVTRKTGAVCAAAVLLATLPLAAVAPSERRPEPPRTYAWVLPDARTASTSEYHIALQVTPAAPAVPPTAAPPSTSAAAPSAADAPKAGPSSLTWHAVAAAPSAAPKEAKQVTWRQAPADAAKAPTAPRRGVASTPARARAEAPARGLAARSRPRATEVVATLDEQGHVRVNVRERARRHGDDAVRFRLESHGATSASIEVRLDPELTKVVRSVAAGVQCDTCRAPPSRRPTAVKKFDAVIRRAALDRHNDLALRVLRDVSAGVADDEAAARRRTAGTSGGA
jgi:beta-lactamase regulating signal transducer with metallopeptidase domain